MAELNKKAEEAKKPENNINPFFKKAVDKVKEVVNKATEPVGDFKLYLDSTVEVKIVGTEKLPTLKAPKVLRVFIEQDGNYLVRTDAKDLEFVKKGSMLEGGDGKKVEVACACFEYVVVNVLKADKRQVPVQCFEIVLVGHEKDCPVCQPQVQYVQVPVAGAESVAPAPVAVAKPAAAPVAEVMSDDIAKAKKLSEFSVLISSSFKGKKADKLLDKLQAAKPYVMAKNLKANKVTKFEALLKVSSTSIYKEWKATFVK